MKALIVSANQFEDLELLVPFYRLQEAGYDVHVSAGVAGVIAGKHGYEVKVDKTFAAVDPGNYDLLILPGGKAPAVIRDDARALEIVHAFFNTDKLVGAICHGPKVLAAAGLLRGRRATCYRTLAKEIRDAGADYQDSEVVVDGRLVTSRQTDDLPAFMRTLIGMMPP